MNRHLRTVLSTVLPFVDSNQDHLLGYLASQKDALGDNLYSRLEGKITDGTYTTKKEVSAAVTALKEQTEAQNQALAGALESLAKYKGILGSYTLQTFETDLNDGSISPEGLESRLKGAVRENDSVVRTFNTRTVAVKNYLSDWRNGNKPTTVRVPTGQASNSNSTVLSSTVLDNLLDDVKASTLADTNQNATYLLAVRAQLSGDTQDFHDYGLRTAELIGVRGGRAGNSGSKAQHGYDKQRDLKPIKVDNRYVTNEEFASLFVELAESLYKSGDKFNAIDMVGALTAYKEAMGTSADTDYMKGLTKRSNELHGRMKIESANEQLYGKTPIRTKEDLGKIVDIYREVVDGDKALYASHPNAADKKQIITVFDSYNELLGKLSQGGSDAPNVDDQIKTYENLVNVAGIYIEGRMKLAEAYVEANKIHDAMQTLQRAEELDPENVDVLTLLGRCYLDDGDLGQAQVKFNKANHLLEQGATGFRTTAFDALKNLSEVEDALYLVRGN